MRVIRPTARGWVLGLGSAIWFVVALVNHNVLSGLFACGGLALTAASLLFTLGSLRRVAVHRGPAGDAATGKPVSLPLVVRNELSRWRQAMVVQEACPFAPDGVHVTAVEALGPGEERVVSRRILALKRGEFALNRVVLRSGDPAGLFQCEKAISLPKKVLVLPGVVPLPGLVLRARHSLPTPTGDPMSGAGASQEFYGVREYNPSDGMRRIHWRSSARCRRLMVREFERHSVMSVAVLVDAHERNVSGVEHWSNLEYLIRAAASLIRHVGGLYCQLAVGAGGAREVILPSGPAARVEWEALLQLARLQPGSVALADVALSLGEHLPPATVVYCLSLSTPARLTEALGLLGSEGMTVRWFCAAPESFRRPENRLLRADSARAVTRGLVDVVQLHPGLPVDRALSHAA